MTVAGPAKERGRSVQLCSVKRRRRCRIKQREGCRLRLKGWKRSPGKGWIDEEALVADPKASTVSRRC